MDAWPHSTCVAPAARWLTAQATLRCCARGNPGLNGEERTEVEGYPPPSSIAPSPEVPALKTPTPGGLMPWPGV